jgi:hypothetical protein
MTTVSDQFKPGDRVLVLDAGLEMLRNIMRQHGHDPKPNHHGTVAELYDGDEVLINFDDGGCAPYPINDVRRLA